MASPGPERLPFDRKRADEEAAEGGEQQNSQRFAVLVAYDGTDFFGWQIQNSGGAAKKNVKCCGGSAKSEEASPPSAAAAADDVKKDTQEVEVNTTSKQNSKNKKSQSPKGSPAVTTIQACLEKRLSSVFSKTIAIAGSGRTDRGVHASGQVFHFDAPRVLTVLDKKLAKNAVAKQRKESHNENESQDEKGGESTTESSPTPQTTASKKEKKLLYTRDAKVIDAATVEQYLRNGLPSSIQVLQVTPVPRSFHARESCIKKRYQYSVAEGVASPSQSRFCYSVGHGKTLDISKMQEAANYLLGRHDFRSFGVIEEGDPRSPVRDMMLLEVTRDGGGGTGAGFSPALPASHTAGGASPSTRQGSTDEEEESRQGFGARIPRECSIVRVTAICNRFIWHMMRMVAGTLIEVGLGRITPQDVKMLLDAKERRCDGQAQVRTAPAAGLCLKHVYYPEELCTGEGKFKK